MAYKLGRSNKLVEQIELDNGTILDIDINVGEMSMTFNQERNKVIRAEKMETTPENLENLGNVAINFYSYVLGKENVEKLLEYYDNNWVEMIDMLTPFITDVVTPAITKYLKGKQDKVLLYKKGKRR